MSMKMRRPNITVDAEIGNYKRRFVALVNRANRSQVDTLYFTWK